MGTVPGRTPFALTPVFLPSSGRSLTRVNTGEYEPAQALRVVIRPQARDPAGELEASIVLERARPVRRTLAHEARPRSAPTAGALHDRAQEQHMLARLELGEQRLEVLLRRGG